jgi:hypothetical protein
MGPASREEGRKFLGVLDEHERVRPQIDREGAQPLGGRLIAPVSLERDHPTTPRGHGSRHDGVELAP